jgi:nuclear pore complex protein Nup98-Nup96
MTDADIAFHHSFKSTFNPRDEYLLLKPKGTAPRTKTPMPETHLRTVGNFELMTKSLISKKNLPDVSSIDLSLIESTNKYQLQSEQMHFQKSRTEISDFDEIPVASMESTSFGSLASLIDIEQTAVDPLAMQEKQIWSLAFILFDDFTDDVSLGVPDDLRDEFAHRVRKDRLCRFWRDIVVKEKVAKDLAKNLSREEDAIVHLTAGNVKAACTSLLEAKDFHLTTLVAQAPGDQVFREGIRGQIDEWRESNMLSEMTDPIRALYEILAGNACKVDGVKGQLVDRASEFIISERFNLSWQQAFALRLWYVIYEDEPLEEAIISFDNDIMSFADSAWPSPFDDDKRKDLEAQKAEWLISPLWTLLQIYAASKSPASKFNPSIELPAQIMPKTITGDIFNTRLTFQLYHALCARKKEGQLKFRTSPTLSDQLTVDFASQIAASGQFIFAALIFLYLTNPDERARSIKELLARNAPFIPERDSSPLADDIWSSFCGDLLLPEPWIWEALALHARSYRNCPEDSLDDATLAHAVAPSDEVRYLLEAENWDEAHSTLCRVVAPTAIIEREYEALVTLLLGFQDQPEHKVKGWDVGGGVYMDFVNIMLGRVEGKDRGAVLGRLVEGLTRMKGKGGMAFQESVAMREMAGTVADLVGEERGKNKNRVSLRHPAVSTWVSFHVANLLTTGCCSGRDRS